MDFLSLLIGMLATIVALALGVLSLGGKIRAWFKSIAAEALMDAKLIRYPAEGIKNWPNGADTLPDALEHLWDTQSEIKAKVDQMSREE